MAYVLPADMPQRAERLERSRTWEPPSPCRRALRACALGGHRPPLRPSPSKRSRAPYRRRTARHRRSSPSRRRGRRWAPCLAPGQAGAASRAAHVEARPPRGLGSPLASECHCSCGRSGTCGHPVAPPAERPVPLSDVRLLRGVEEQLPPTRVLARPCAVVNGDDMTTERCMPTKRCGTALPVGLLPVEEETLVEKTDLAQRLPTEQKHRPDDEVRTSAEAIRSECLHPHAGRVTGRATSRVALARRCRRVGERREPTWRSLAACRKRRAARVRRARGKRPGSARLRRAVCPRAEAVERGSHPLRTRDSRRGRRIRLHGDSNDVSDLGRTRVVDHDDVCGAIELDQAAVESAERVNATMTAWTACCVTLLSHSLVESRRARTPCRRGAS